MFKNLIVIAMLVGSATVAQARQNCAVGAKNSASSYSEILAMTNLDLNNGQAKVIYQAPTFVVGVQKSEDGTLQISTYAPYAKKVFAIAVGKGPSLTLLDAKNKIAVTCTEQ